MLSVVGTVALDTLAHVKRLAAAEATGAVERLQPDMPGGTGGNVAMALARLGAPVRLLSAVGRDFAGTAYASLLAASGVDATALEVVELPTSRAYVFYEESGAQVTYFYAGASRAFTAKPGLVPGGRAHFCAGEISQYPALMQQAEWVSFDPGQEVFHRDLGEVEACLPHVDILFVNRNELEVLESRAGWALPRLLALGMAAVVETRGNEGTLVHTPAGRFAAPAVPVRATDPTGAGDAHRAGFLYAMDRGAELGVAARFANVLGGFAVEHVGAQAGQPTLAAALERYEKAYGALPF